MNPAAVILDCGLNTSGGHHIAHLNAVVAALQGQCRISRIVTNDGVDIDAFGDIPVHPITSITGYEAISNPICCNGDSASHAEYAKALSLDLLTRTDLFEAADHIYVLNATPLIVSALHLWLELRGKKLLGKLSIYMLTGFGVHARTSGHGVWLMECDPDRRRSLQYDLTALAQLTSDLTVHVTSLKRQLIARELGVGNVSLYNINTTAHRQAMSRRRERSGYVSLYIGDAKFEKGFSNICNVVSLFRRKLPHLGVQIHVNDPTSAYGATIAKIRDLAAVDPRVRLVEGFLTQEQYVETLQASDIAILSYDPVYYHDMESGVARECLVNNIPFLCRRGTLTADELIENGGECFTYSETEELPKLAARIYNSYDFYKAICACIGIKTEGGASRNAI